MVDFTPGEKLWIATARNSVSPVTFIEQNSKGEIVVKTDGGFRTTRPLAKVYKHPNDIPLKKQP